MLDDLNITSSSQDNNNIKPKQLPQLQQNIIQKQKIITNQSLKPKKEYKKSDMMMKYDNTEGKILLYDRYKTFIGYVTILQLIKYITNDISKDFLKLCDFEPSIGIINRYFILNESDKIILISHLNSPIMGNLDIVFKIYSGINSYIINNLQNDLAKLDNNEYIKYTIRKKINELVYLLLNHSLKLLVFLSEISKQKDMTPSAKESLLKNSIIVMNKLNHIIKSEIDEKTSKSLLFAQQLSALENITTTTKNKLDSMETIIKTQNEKINKILDYIQIRDDDFDKVYNKGNKIFYEQEKTESQAQKTNTQSITHIPPLNFADITNFRDSDYRYEESGKDGIQNNNIGYLTP
jgi:hypothetical protein